MRRFSRIAFIIVGGAAIVGTAGFIALRLFAPTGLIRDTIERELCRFTPAKVCVGSSRVSFAFPEVIALTVEDLAVSSPGDDPLFSAKRVTLSPSIASVFRGEFAVTSLRVDGFRCTITRTASGDILAPLPVFLKPSDSASHEPEGALSRPPDSSSETPVPAPTPRVAWSLKSVRLNGGRIDWIDRCTIPGQEIAVPFREIAAKLIRTTTPNRFTVKGAGLLGAEDTSKNLVTLDGSLSVDPEKLEPLEANLVCSAPNVDLRVCEGYVPGPLRGLKQVVGQARAEWTWARNRGPNLSLKAAFRRGPAGATSVDLDGEVVGSATFDKVDQAACSVRVASLPLGLLADMLPASLPFQPSDATVGADFDCTWNGADKWRLSGEVSLSDVLTTGALKAMAPAVSAVARLQLEPHRLLIDSLEVSAASQLALLKGAIDAPLSAKPTANLTAEVTGDGRWIEALGLVGPEALVVAGNIPFRARIHGSLDQMDFECSGGLTGTTVSIARALEKPRGKKAAITMRGRWSPGTLESGGEGRITSAVAADLSGVRPVLAEESPNAGTLSLHVDSAVSCAGSKVALERISVIAKSDADQSAVLTASATVREGGTPGQIIEGFATLSIAGTVAAALERSAGVRITGTSTAKARFASGPARVEWSAELPLGPLGIELENKFGKPAGVDGVLRAAGSSSEKGARLKRGELTLPGISAVAQGLLRDRKAAFGGLALELKQVDLRQLAEYSRPTIPADIGGSVRGSLAVKQAEKGLALAGTVKLSDTSYRPRGALWGLEGIEGDLKIDGDTIAIPQLSGTVTGFAHGRFQVNGELKQAASLEALGGQVSLSMGKGKIKADRLVKIINDAHSLIGRLLQPRPIAMESDYIEFSSLDADFRIRDGKAVTNSFRMRGAEINTGFVGELAVGSLNLDGMLGIHATVAGSDTLSRIPGVRQLMEDHKDLLVKLPITVFAGLRGPLASSLEVLPVQENRVKKEVAARLHELMK